MPYNTDNELGSSDLRDVWDNAANADRAVNSQESQWTDRLGRARKTWAGLEKDNAEKIEETRQNLIPLSRQYMTLAAAQADISNIPVGSVTYVRSSDDSALAVEYLNKAGALTATGRKMPSQKTVEQISTTLQRMYAAIHVISDSSTSSADEEDLSRTVQGAMTAIHEISVALSESSQNQDRIESGLSSVLAALQVHAETIISVSESVLPPEDLSVYSYADFGFSGSVNSANGSISANSQYRRTGMIPVKKGDVVTFKMFTHVTAVGHGAVLYDINGNFTGPLSITCASYAEYKERYYKCEISEDGYFIANTLDQGASQNKNVSEAEIVIDRSGRGRKLDGEIKITKSDLVAVKLNNASLNATSFTVSDGLSYATGLYRCSGGRLNFSGLPVAKEVGKPNSTYNVVFFNARKELIAYRPVFSSSGYVVIPEDAAYFAQQITTERAYGWEDFSICYQNYLYNDELNKFLKSERNRLNYLYPNEYYIQDFSGATDSAWIQGAVDWVASAGGGWLILSTEYTKPRFIISESVIHRANVWIVLDGVEIKLQDGVHDNLFRAEGVITNPADPYGLCIGLNITNNVRLIGLGYAKISGADVPRYADIPSGAGPRYWIGDEYGWRGTGLIYYGAQNFEIGGFKLQNVKNWGMDTGYGGKYGFFHDIEIWQPNKNGDGVHFTNGASNMRVHNIFGYARDDCLALVNSDDSLKYGPDKTPTPGSIRQWIYPTCPFWYGWAGNDEVGNSNDIHDIVATNIGLTGNEQVCTVLTTEFKIYNVSVSGLSSVNYMTPGRGWDEVSSMFKCYAAFGDGSRYKPGNISNISLNNIIEGSSKDYSILISASVRNFTINRYFRLDSRSKTKGALDINSNARPGVKTTNIIE
ncbi:hypothetical protein AAFN90_00930 [Erwiniaceae bacterium CAU 1747]